IGHMTIRPGQTFGVAALEESVAAVRDAFGRLGHVGPLETPRQRANPGIEIDTAELRDADQPLVDLIVELTAGPPSETGLVRIAGNDLTRHEVIRREIQVFPGDVLDWPALRESQRDIRNSRLFDPDPPDRGVKVTIQDAQESTSLPGDPPATDGGDAVRGSGRIAPADLTVRDVLIEVEETNTGSFDIGAAVSSDAGLLGRIALTQRNFDITDTPDSFGELVTGRAFRGDGQTFQIEAQPGTEVQVYSLSLAEPSLLETNYTGSVRVFFRDREFDEFDEQRFGGSLTFGRRFGTRWTGNVRTRVESVEISDIDQDFPEDFFLFTDPTLLIGIGPTLARTTTDDRLFPTRGTRTEIGFEQVTGDTSFSEIRGEHIVFVPVYEDFRGRRTVISFRTQAAYIPQDSDDVPVFERQYLGGQTFRGFGFRTISPKGVSRDTGAFSDEPIGGTWLYINTLEARHPLVADSVYGAVFMDAGTVREDIGLEDWRVSAGVGVRVRIPQLSPAPLAFDFGFPIVKQFGDEERVFSFSLDLPF
ncbi:MAG: BamA/TamA family outer membrane protein, partial [Planctomycetota bacterium]